MEEKIDISIIIPYYNSHNYIYEALKSVEAYNGNYIYEVIIIDDGSEDLDALNVLKDIENSSE